jgi:RimJ/RimL family protein N-acetyltransferase
MGDGDAEPHPTFCITVDDGPVVGWVDYDRDERAWLAHDDVNIGYGLHPDARGRGLATRAVLLLLHHLSVATDVKVATLLIDPENQWSLGIPRRCGFVDHGTLGDNGSRYFKKPVPPMSYSDGVVTIEPWRLEDVAEHVAGTDEEQIRWLWPEHRADWEAKSHEQRLEHVRGVFEQAIAVNATGPKWSFGVHVHETLVGHVDCDLANEHVPHGESNISYTIWPEHRGKGYAARAARLVVDFVGDHTGAREVHVLVDPANEASLRVARAIGAHEVERAAMVRHVLPVVRGR